MKLFISYFIIVLMTSCNNPSNHLKSPSTSDSLDISTNSSSMLNGEIQAFVINKELSQKFDSIMSVFEKYNKNQSEYDTLSVFKLNGLDTLININEVAYLNDIDPYSANYLFDNDTIIGGNGFCNSENYLFNKKLLTKVILYDADCVESSSSLTIIINFYSSQKKWMYVKNVEDIWDDVVFKKGIEMRTTESIVFYENGLAENAIQRRYINCRKDLHLIDTLKFEIIDNDRVSYLEPKIIRIKKN